MSTEMSLLYVTAASIGFFHTILGPDHYLPFVFMAKARGWSNSKTAWITALCGIGHVGSSIVLGLVGVALGVAVGKLEMFESVRGSLAGWALLAFGLIYCAWGLRRAYRRQPHTHSHLAGDVAGITHAHGAEGDHAHDHDSSGKVSITPWVLFTVFVLGPCEPLIPLLMYPAAAHSPGAVLGVAGIFAATTITTMVAVVLLATAGIRLLPLRPIERFTHAIAGASIALCGIAVTFLGL